MQKILMLMLCIHSAYAMEKSEKIRIVEFVFKKTDEIIQKVDERYAANDHSTIQGPPDFIRLSLRSHLVDQNTRTVILTNDDELDGFIDNLPIMACSLGLSVEELKKQAREATLEPVTQVKQKKSSTNNEFGSGLNGLKGAFSKKK